MIDKSMRILKLENALEIAITSLKQANELIDFDDDYERQYALDHVVYLEKILSGPTPKEEKCNSCRGTGHYDHNGSPRCGACNGTGIEQN